MGDRTQVSWMPIACHTPHGVSTQHPLGILGPWPAVRIRWVRRCVGVGACDVGTMLGLCLKGKAGKAGKAGWVVCCVFL